MSELKPQLAIKEPVSVFSKPLLFDWKALFKALSGVAGNAAQGKWAEAGTKTVESMCALGLATQPQELAYLLIRRSLLKAIFDLLGESVSLQLQPKDAEAVVARMEFSEALQDVRIGREFLERPAQLPVIEDLQPLLRAWLETHDVPTHSAHAIAARLPSYFVYALNEQWHHHRSTYQPLLEALNTPFTRAGEVEWQWAEYSSLLSRRVQEALFDEPFSLAQIYVPLNAYYEDVSRDRLATDAPSRVRKRIVVSLEAELARWLDETQPECDIRVISGGPGSGKSSFLRIFAATTSRQGKFKVLFVPLHLIDTSRDLVDEVGRFVRDEGILSHNPLAAESKETDLLVVFDGLDELAAQGKAAAEIARAFLREVERTVERRNVQSIRLRVLISGRELVVQENEAEFRRPRQVLTLLPYLKSAAQRSHAEEFVDPDKLLEQDQRDVWWRNYGQLTGRNYSGLPEQLNREDLIEITAQPLLNYLVALSIVRGRLDFEQEINLNSIYADLIAAVHDRGYEKYGSHRSIRHMRLEDFERVLEEIGLAAWHGDSRSTTVREIEDYCRNSGLGKQLDAFREGAEAGVTRLLAAFFFRRYGERASDPTFVFTHKSFGEYLAARRIVRAVGKMIRELQAHASDPDSGWDEREALKHWAQICGPSPITSYLRNFMVNEIASRAGNYVNEWQQRLTQLFNFMIRHGLPVDQFGLRTFRQMQFRSRNAEESFLVTLCLCADQTAQNIEMDFSSSYEFGDWYTALARQFGRAGSSLAISHLSRLTLQECAFPGADFMAAVLHHANLERANANFANFSRTTMLKANLRGAKLDGASFHFAYMPDAQLTRASMIECNLTNAILRGADLTDVKLFGANLTRTNLEGANLTQAILTGAILRGASFKGAILTRSVFDLSAKGCPELRDVDVSQARFLPPNSDPDELTPASQRPDTTTTRSPHIERPPSRA